MPVSRGWSSTSSYACDLESLYGSFGAVIPPAGDGLSKLTCYAFAECLKS